MTLSLALRNLLRNRRRSLATLLALAIGASAILVFGGYSTSIRYTMLSAYVRSGGHLQVQHRDFFLHGSANPTAYAIKDYQRLVDAIRSDETLGKLALVVTPKLQFGGIAGNYDAGVSRNVLGAGYVAADYARMRHWNEFGIRLEPLPFQLEGTSADSAVVGGGVARGLMLCAELGVTDCAKPEQEPTAVPAAALPTDIAELAASEKPASAPAPTGARIELLASHGRGTPNVATLNVVAAAAQGFKELDDVALLMHLGQAQQLIYGRTDPRATAIMVQLRHTAHMPQARKRLEALLAQVAPGQRLTVLDFESLNPFYVQTQQLFDTIFTFIFALIGAIVLFTIGNTMTAAVVERTVEIGTLRAVGLRRGGVRGLFMTEGLLLGGAGAAIGVLTALAVEGAITVLGITWLPPASSERVPLSVVVWGEVGMIVGITAGLIAIAIASAWWPAHRAARLNIVEALRHA